MSIFASLGHRFSIHFLTHIIRRCRFIIPLGIQRDFSQFVSMNYWRIIFILVPCLLTAQLGLDRPVDGFFPIIDEAYIAYDRESLQIFRWDDSLRIEKSISLQPGNISTLGSILYKAPITLYLIDPLEQKVLEMDIYLSVRGEFYLPDGPVEATNIIWLDAYAWLIWDRVSEQLFESSPGSSTLRRWGDTQLKQYLLGDISMIPFEKGILFWSNDTQSLIATSKWGKMMDEQTLNLPRGRYELISSSRGIILSGDFQSYLINVTTLTIQQIISDFKCVGILNLNGKSAIVNTNGEISYNW